MVMESSSSHHLYHITVHMITCSCTTIKSLLLAMPFVSRLPADTKRLKTSYERR